MENPIKIEFDSDKQRIKMLRKLEELKNRSRNLKRKREMKEELEKEAKKKEIDKKISLLPIKRRRRRRLRKLLGQQKNIEEIALEFSSGQKRKLMYTHKRGNNVILLFDILPKNHKEIELMLNEVFDKKVILKSQLGMLREEGRMKGRKFQI